MRKVILKGQVSRTRPAAAKAERDRLLKAQRASPLTKSGKPDQRFKAQRDKRKVKGPPNMLLKAMANAKLNPKFKAEHEADKIKRDRLRAANELNTAKTVDDMLLKFDGLNWAGAKPAFFDEIPQADPEMLKAMAQLVSERKIGEHRLAPDAKPEPKAGTYTLNNILDVARSLEPIAGTEYARGVTELIGRLVLDVSVMGEGTSENAKIFALLVCTP